MENLLGLLCVLLLVVLPLVAAGGHLLWLLFAALGRWLFPTEETPAPARRWPREERPTPCVRCSHLLESHQRRCPKCRLHRDGAAAAELLDLQATARQLQRLLDSGDLDRITIDPLYACIEARQQWLLKAEADQHAPIPLAEEPVRPPAVEPLEAPHRPVVIAVTAEEAIPEVLPIDDTPVRVEPFVPVEVIPPPPPRRPLGQVLAAFMEDRNILWGELVGGLLIVGCSIALVISLWQTLESIPYFPFLILAGTTAALFGAGLYTLHHWKLLSTSKGLLIIATLLVPLNFLVLAGLSKGQAGGWLEVVVELLAVTAFTWLVSRAAQVVAAPELLPGVRGGHWLLALAVLGAAVGQLLVPRLVDLRQPAQWLFYLAGLLPVACQGTAVGLVLRGSARTGPLRDRQANALLTFLGLATFALSVAMGFLIFWSADVGLTLQRLSILLALAGVPVLATGLLLFREVEVSGPVRTAGTAVALAGAVAMLTALGLAWPRPMVLVLVCAINVVVLTTAALRGRLPLLHALAMPCLLLGYLTGFHQLAGHLTLETERPGWHLLQQLLSSSSGVALAGLVVILALVSEGLRRRGRTADGRSFAIGSAAIASLSLVLVSLHGSAAPGQAALIYGLYGIGCLAMNARWQWPRFTYVGTTLLLGCLLLAMLKVPIELEWRGLLALLGHAVLFVAASLVLGGRRFEPALSAIPFRRAALASTLIALPLLPLAAKRPELAWLAGCVLVISAVWLVVAWTERWPLLFSAFQAALTTAVVIAVSAWLQAPGMMQPRGLQAYGLALGVLALMWAMVRWKLATSKRALPLLEPAWPAVDRIVLVSLVAGQLVLVGACVLPGVIEEFGSLGRNEASREICGQAFQPLSWLLTGVLALTLGVSLWGRRGPDAVLGLTVLALTVPVMLAGPFVDHVATATALRWTLAAAFLGGSVLLWLRAPLARLATAARIRFENHTDPSPTVRWLLVAGCVVPVLVLTAGLVGMRFLGQRPAGPLAGTFFREIGSLARLLVPMGLVGVALLGHALRERSAGYAFASGLIVNAGLVGGYALSVVIGAGQFGGPERVQLLQLGASGAAVWAIGWSLLRRWAIRRGLHTENGSAMPLRWVQVGIGVALLAVLLGIAVYLLVAGLPVLDTTAAAGSWLGWLAFGLVTASGVLYGRQPWIARTQMLSMAALAAVALAACTVERLAPTHGYRTLMLGLGGLALALSLWSGGEIVLIGLLALGLAGKAALWHQDPLGAAGAVALVSLAAAALAYRRRQEAWALVAGLGAPLATALVVWHVWWSIPFAGWWVYLAQACLVSLSMVALLWLIAKPARSASEGESNAPLLAVQVLLGLVGNGLLLTPALVQLLARPAGPMSFDLLQIGQWSGWLALLPALLAAVWYARLIAPRLVIHAAGVGGLLLGVLAACLAARWDSGGWLAHHIWTVAWSLLGLAMLLAGWAGATLPLLGPAFWSLERRAYWAERLAEFFPARSAQRWVEVLGLLVVGLALRGAWGDPARPYWSSLATLGVSATAAALAVWTRRPYYVYASGLLVNVVGLLAWQAWLVDEVGFVGWWAWGPGILSSFIYTHALCLAVASALWALIERTLRHRQPPIELRGSWPPFPPLASFLALQLLALLILGGLASDLTGTEMHASGRLAWLALVTAAVAALAQAGEMAAGGRRVSPQLYCAGLLAVGLALHSAGLSPRWLCWAAALALAGYVLLVRVLLGLVPRLAFLRRSERAPSAWLAVAQLLLALLVLALSVWISLDFGLLQQRLAGPLAVALLLAAALLAVPERASVTHLYLALGDWQLFRHAVLLLGVVLLVLTGWAFLPPGLPAPWLHRNVLLMVSLVGLAVGYGLGLERLPRRDGEWARAARQLGPVLGGLACALLAVVLVQELVLYNPHPDIRRTPLVLPAVLVVAIALLFLMAGAIVLAVSPRRDPLGLSERGRTLYVYAAEVLLVLLLVHLRLNVPDLLPSFIGQRWPVVLVSIAFLGVGLAEWFERRGLHVLAGPLRRTGVFLPLLPVAAYLLRPVTTELRQVLGRTVTGLQPLLSYLDKLPGGYEMHALVWFLLGGLYVLLAVTRRSSVYGLLAALAANFGLWVVLANQAGAAFLVHPQFWLVPLALILLAAGHVNRERLTSAQAGAVRYGALLLLYLSSTADMFIVGLGESVVWPLVLALLAVGGVLAGLVLRVRAFLYLGVSFLFLVVFAQIWHAAVDRRQTWVWWVSGIVLGAAILTLFAIFEKRRNDVLRLVEQIKKWE